MLQPGFSAGYVSTSVGSVHFRQHGTGAKTAVMLHQGGSSSRECVSVAGHLDGYRVIMPDIPGHGESAECQQGSIERYAQGIAELIDGLGIEELALFGHHFGGVVAVETAMLLGERVRHLILSNTPYVDEHARELRVGEEPRSFVEPRADGSHLTKLWETRSALYRDDVPIVNRYIAENLLLGESIEQSHRAVATYRMEDRYRRLQPLTYVHGTADPYIAIEVEHAVSMFAPDRVVTFEGGTVALVDQSAERLARVISETVG